MAHQRRWQKTLAQVVGVSTVCSCLLVTTAGHAAAAAPTAGLLVSYDFSQTSGTTLIDSATADGIQNGTISGTPAWSNGIMQFTGTNWVKLPDGLLTGKTAATVTVEASPAAAALTKAAFLWNLGGSGNSATGQFFVATNGHRAVISKNNYAAERAAVSPTAFTANAWQSIVTTIAPNAGGSTSTLTLYVNGVQVAQKTDSDTGIANLLVHTNNLIGASAYSADPKFTGSISQYRLYDRALTASEVQSVAADDAASVGQDQLSAINLGDLSTVSANLALPTAGGVSWSTSDASVVEANGVIHQTAAAGTATLTAAITVRGQVSTRAFPVTLAPALGAEAKAQQDLADIAVPNLNGVRGDLTLPQTGTKYGSALTWSASPTGIISTATTNGVAPGVVTRPAQDTTVTLTAAVAGTAATRSFSVKVLAAPPARGVETGYLFAYFTDTTPAKSSDEQMYFASSLDGAHWTDLNNNQPVLTSNVGEKGVRDPYLVRSPEGDRSFLIATDLSSFYRGGWSTTLTAGSTKLVVWESTDLVNWGEPRLVDVASQIPGAGAAWAPEAFWDSNTHQYVVYWATPQNGTATGSDLANVKGDVMNIYYATTRDFVTFSRPVLWIDSTQATLDTSMLKDGDWYYRVSVLEAQITLERSKNPYATLSGSTQISSDPNQWSRVGTLQSIFNNTGYSNFYLEGPELFKYNKADEATLDGTQVNTWGVMADQAKLGKGYLPFRTTDLSSTTSVANGGAWSTATDVNFGAVKKRHGTILSLTTAEYNAVTQKYGAANVKVASIGASISKSQYTVGDSLDTSGLTVTATMQDGSTRVLNSAEYSLSGFDSSSAGNKTVTVTFQAGQNITTTLTITVSPVVDVTAPVVTASLDPAVPSGAAGWYTGAVSLTVSATDDMSGVASTQYRLGDGVWTSYTGPVALPEGTSTVGYRATDGKGNVSAVQTISVKRDITAPVVSAAFNDAGGTTEGPVSLSLSATDGGSGVDTLSYSLDGGSWTSYGDPIAVAGAGTHVVAYHAVDNAGNSSAVSSATVTIAAADTTAPVVSAVTEPGAPSGAAGWYTTPVKVVLTASDDRSGVASVEYRVGSGAWAAYAEPIVVDEGTTVVSYRATDGKGNVSAVQTVSVKRDVQAPVVSATFDDAGGASEGPVSVALSATDAVSGVETVSYSVDGGAWTAYTGAVSVAGAGVHAVTYQAVDVAGNASAARTASVKIAAADTTAPVVTAATNPASASGDNGWYVDAVAVALSAVDDRSGVASIEYRLAGGSWATYSTAVTVPEGVIDVEYRATDGKGNVSEPKTLTVRRDVTKPSTAASYDDQDGNAVGPIQVTLVSTDAGSGVAAITYSVNGGAAKTYTGPFEVAGNGATMTWSARDNAGNVEATKSATIRLTLPDTTAPVVTGTVSPGVPTGVNGWYTGPVSLALSAVDDRSGVDSITYRADSGTGWSAFAAYTGSINAPVGTTTYQFRAADGAGNVSGFSSVTIKRDEEAPVVTSTVAATSSTVSTVTLAAVDPVSGVGSVSYRVDSGAWRNYSAPFTISGAGMHSLQVTATDKAGNASTAVTSQVLVGADKSAPLLLVSSTPSAPNGNNGWYKTPVSITASATDYSGVAKIEYRIGSSTTAPWVAYTGPVSASAGAFSYGFRATDAKGNVSAIKTATVKYDNTIPVTTAAFNDLNGTGSAPVKITLSRTDSISGVSSTWYRIDNSGWTLYSAPFYVADPGSHTVSYSTVDKAGNIEGAKTSTVRISGPDTTTPALTVTTNPAAPDGANDWFKSSTRITATATDPATAGQATAGVKQIDYQIGTGAWKKYTTAITAPTGTTTYNFRVTDNAGNVSQTTTVTIKRDTTAPTTSATYTNNQATAVPVTIKATDTTSGVAITTVNVDNTGWVTYTGPIQVTGKGTHTVAYTATDNAGNTATTKTATITVK